MPPLDEVTREHVLAAIEEHDRVGRGEFMSTRGLESTPDYALTHAGSDYDSVAILVVASELDTGEAWVGDDVNDGEVATSVLRGLEFEASAPPSPRATPANRAAWAEAARELLLRVAARYGETVTYKAVAAEVQETTGQHTLQLQQHWIGDVLARVTADCADREEPLLSALCVDTRGSVGAGYARALEAIGRSATDDPDRQAAEERLACHRHFGAKMPSDGGRPTLVDKLSRSRTRERRVALEMRAPKLCPACFLALPASGECDNCA